MSVSITWQQALDLSETPEVDEALTAFLDDPTEDQGVMIVVNTVEAFKRSNLPAVPTDWLEAVQEFVTRCERGEVRSVKTYTTFKKLLNDLGDSHVLPSCAHDWVPGQKGASSYCCKCGEVGI